MPCNNCGGAMTDVQVDPVEESGYFREEYKCTHCSARGYVSGQEEQPPSEWNKYGGAFK